VLTAVGLLPIAVAGIDVDELLDGARAAMKESLAGAMDYAAMRNVLYEKGFSVEIMSCFEPSFAQMNEWWKQIFGETEGKNGRAPLPDSMVFTTDLHSLGQYVQDGKRQLFETIVNIKKSPVEITIPSSDSDDDKLNYLAGKTVSFANQVAYRATALAHSEGGVPVMSIDILELNPHEIGCFI
jgi:glucose-6-phosphate isomerase